MEEGVKGKETVNSFWNRYQSILVQHGVPEEHAGWYVRWCRNFAESQKAPLNQCSGRDVLQFIERLAGSPLIKAWQVKQATEALRFLYQECPDVSWALKWEWNKAEQHGGALSTKKSDRTSTPRKAVRVRPVKKFKDALPGHSFKEEYAGLINRLRKIIRPRHYSLRTEQTYESWTLRFLAYIKKCGISIDSAEAEQVGNYLNYLVEERQVSASTQSQALNALVFLFEQALKKPLGTIGDFTRSRRPRKLPEVLTLHEVDRLLQEMSGTAALTAGLMYGSGLRLMECVRLRVKDIDFEQRHIKVWGKGRKHRITVLPERYEAELRDQMKRVKAMHDSDLAAGHGEVYMEPALGLAVCFSGRPSVD